MQINALPDDIDTLKRFILERDATVAQLQQQLTVKQQESVNLSLLIEKLKLQIARFKRTQFGQSLERYPGELMQLELLVEDLQANQAQTRVAESDQPVPPFDAACGGEGSTSSYFATASAAPAD